jgi:NAD+ diphosphatase
MLGFLAEWESGDIVIDPVEIADAGWFSADAMPLIPPRMSIARMLIDDWLRRQGQDISEAS